MMTIFNTPWCCRVSECPPVSPIHDHDLKRLFSPFLPTFRIYVHLSAFSLNHCTLYIILSLHCVIAPFTNRPIFF